MRFQGSRPRYEELRRSSERKPGTGNSRSESWINKKLKTSLGLVSNLRSTKPHVCWQSKFQPYTGSFSLNGKFGKRALSHEHLHGCGLGHGVSPLVAGRLILHSARRRNVLLISEHPPASPSSLPRIRSPSSTTLNCVAGPGSFLDAVHIAAHHRHNRALHDVSPAGPL